ncbi:MAG: hypothetical protein AB7F59_13350 [Bdellovibrionales bacterium]
MKWFITIAMHISLTAMAEDKFAQPDLQNISRSGNLVTLNVQPGEKTISFSLVGKPMVVVDLANAHIDVLILEQNRKRTLKLKKLSHGEYVSELSRTRTPIEMEVRVKVGDNTEKFDVVLPQRK